MKIRAIRLRETGGFIKPRAVEGFKGGLDVLAGPNELGKSTLLKALQLALFEKHTTTKGVARVLKPLTGGAPLIEVDFETDAGLWRLRKQFFSGKAASLIDLGKGQVIARGADAEEEIHRLLNGNIGNQDAPGILWLGQTAALAPLQPDEDQQAMLRRVIEAEVTDTAGDGRSRELLRQVAHELGALVTATGRKKTGGAYADAVRSRDSLATELDQVTRQLASAEEKLSRLQVLTTRAAQLTQTDTVRSRLSAVEASQKALATSRKTRSELVNAQTVLDKHVVEQAASARSLAEFDAGMAAFAAVETRLGAAKPKHTELLVKIEHCEKDIEAGTSKAAILQKETAAAGARLKEFTTVEAADVAGKKLNEIVERQARACASQNAVTSLFAELNSSTVTPQLVDAARREYGAIVELEAQLGAGAPKVSIAYLKGISGAIRIDGTPAGDGATFEPTAPLQLEIEGVGTITIEPGLGDDVVDLRSDLESHREQYGALLGQMDISDLTAAETLLKEWNKLEQRLGESRAQLNALAPGGLALLDAEISELTRLVGGAEGTEADTQNGEALAVPQSREELEQVLADLETMRSDMLAVQARSNLTLSDLRVELAGIETGTARDNKDIEVLSARLPPLNERADRRLALERHDETCVQGANLARRNVESLAEKSVSSDQLTELEAAYVLAERDKQTADDELATLREDIRELTGGLNALAGEGVETRKVELTDKLAEVQAAVERYESDVAALNLLRDQLELAGRATRDRFLGPIQENVEPYLRLVVPDGDLGLGDNLEFSGLIRDGVFQPYDILSVGTREQIAVLVRLGFARLLASSGAPIPLILDDALVYSDDQRISRAFTALERAADLHQVIVLTCRESGFEALGGNRLKVVDWDVDATAA